MKIKNLGKNALLGLGLSYGVGATPLTRMHTSSNETSLLSEEKSELSSLAKRYTDYSTCINEYMPVVKQYLDETRDATNTRVKSIHDAYMNDDIVTWKDYSNQRTNACEEIFSQALKKDKYSIKTSEKATTHSEYFKDNYNFDAGDVFDGISTNYATGNLKLKNVNLSQSPINGYTKTN